MALGPTAQMEQKGVKCIPRVPLKVRLSHGHKHSSNFSTNWKFKYAGMHVSAEGCVKYMDLATVTSPHKLWICVNSLVVVVLFIYESYLFS